MLGTDLTVEDIVRFHITVYTKSNHTYNFFVKAILLTLMTSLDVNF